MPEINETKLAKRGTIQQQINRAIADVRNAMMENVEANKAVVDTHLRKQKAHYTLLKAKERLHSLERELLN